MNWRPQFRLRSLFILTAIVAVACWVGPPIVRQVREVREHWAADKRRQAELAQRDASYQKTLDLLFETVSDAPSQASPPTD